MKSTAKRARRNPVRLTDGGSPALNFINTCRKTRKGGYTDLLTDYSAFLNWCEETKLIDWDTYLTLDGEQRCYVKEAEMIWCTVKSARECLDELFNSLINGDEVHPLLLERFNTWTVAIRPHLRYATGPKGVALYWHNIDEEMNLPFWLIIAAACELLDSGDWREIKKCPVCGSLFIDRSRRGNRTWCNPNTCGSLKKSKKYFLLKKAA
jgi:predicted RNA-binding Zn ribbon-like protein